MVRLFRGPENLAGVLGLCLLMLGLQQVTAAGMVKAKAWLAPLLIQRAWSQSLAAGGKPVKPWPWADTWPVARLRAEQGGVDLMVLEGDTGNALAFGPGLAAASAPLGSPGLAVIGGHRDTHFAFLRHVRAGDTLALQLPGGGWRRYRVETRRVIDATRESITPEPGMERLLLVTCYPFDALLPGGPLRLVVEAVSAGIVSTKFPDKGKYAGKHSISTNTFGVHTGLYARFYSNSPPELSTNKPG